MKTRLLNTIILTIALISYGKSNAQDLDYNFDGITWEGWTSGSAAGPWSSSFGNNPNGALDITYAVDSKNAVMYAPDDTKPLNGQYYKFIQIIVSNESSQIDLFRVRGKDGTGWFNAVNYSISTNASTQFTTYNIEITESRWLVSSLENWQVIFRKNDSSEISDGAHVYVDKLLVSDSSTASVNAGNAFDFGIYPNPVQNELTIATEEEIASVQIVDLVGNTVLTNSEVNGSVDVSSLTSGVYVIRLTSASGVATSKFVKK